MQAIQIERLDNVTEKAVCINDKWFPKSQIQFVCDRREGQVGMAIYMIAPAWLINKLSNFEFEQMLGCRTFDQTGFVAFTPWTLDVRQDAVNVFLHGRQGEFGK